MSQLLQLRDAVIAGLSAVLPGYTVEGHLGRFTAEDLSKFLLAAPAVRVAVLAVSDSRATTDGTAVDCTVRLGVYVVTRDRTARLSREEAAFVAAEAVILRATDARWGLDFAYGAPAPTAQNLFSAATLKAGVALWAIDLPQPVRLAAPSGDDPELPAALTALFVGLAPRIGAAHEADYIGPIPPAEDEDEDGEDGAPGADEGGPGDDD